MLEFYFLDGDDSPWGVGGDCGGLLAMLIMYLMGRKESEKIPLKIFLGLVKVKWSVALESGFQASCFAPCEPPGRKLLQFRVFWVRKHCCSWPSL